MGISHANGTTKTSEEETPVAKELVLVILKLLTLTQTKIYALKVVAVCGQLRRLKTEVAKEKKNTTTSQYIMKNY